jgi:hypothetical protein
MPESTVRKLREETVEKVVATGVSIVVGLADDRQITFQTGYEGDETDAAVNARLDRTMRFANRLKAVYSLPTLEDELDRHNKTIERFQEDRDAIEKQFAVRQAMRSVELGERKNRAVKTWQASGKHGEFKPQGATARDLDLIQGEMDKAEAEVEQGRKNFQVSMERHIEERDFCAAKVAKAKALAEG